ncbi:MAG: hypothetical protein IJ574_02175 [Bacilli bacterium]|nr:hypothetical protein [Bacilli bacterium]
MSRLKEYKKLLIASIILSNLSGCMSKKEKEMQKEALEFERQIKQEQTEKYEDALLEESPEGDFLVKVKGKDYYVVDLKLLLQQYLEMDSELLNNDYLNNKIEEIANYYDNSQLYTISDGLIKNYGDNNEQYNHASLYKLTDDFEIDYSDRVTFDYSFVLNDNKKENKNLTIYHINNNDNKTTLHINYEFNDNNEIEYNYVSNKLANDNYIISMTKFNNYCNNTESIDYKYDDKESNELYISLKKDTTDKYSIMINNNTVSINENDYNELKSNMTSYISDNYNDCNNISIIKDFILNNKDIIEKYNNNTEIENLIDIISTKDNKTLSLVR